MEVSQSARRLDGLDPLGDLLVALELGEHGGVEGGRDELLARREVVADQAVHDPDLGGDVAQGDAREAVARDQLQRRGEDLLPPCRGIETRHHASIVALLSMRTTGATVLSMWTRRDVERTAVDRHRRRLTAGVVTATVLMSSGAMVIFPLLPTLQSQLGISTADIGFVAAAGFAASLAAELIVAPFADRGRARTMGVIGVLLMVAALGASALATETWHLVAGRALGGFGFGVFMAAASACSCAPTRPAPANRWGASARPSWPASRSARWPRASPSRSPRPARSSRGRAPWCCSA